VCTLTPTILGPTKSICSATYIVLPVAAPAVDGMMEAATSLIERAQGAGLIDARVRPADLIELANAIGWSTASGDHEAGHADRLLDLVLRGAVAPQAQRRRR
jgi:hypothetical protein